MLILSPKARDYAVIDVETTELTPGEIPSTKFWGYADEKGYERFKTTKSFIAFLRKQPPKTLLHHTNFDPIQLLVDGVYELRILRSHNGKLIRCALGLHYLQNTFTIFPVKLAKIFAAFGFKKTSLKNLEKRNYEDCVNVLHCFLELDSRFLRIVGVSPLERGTVAGTTFRAAELHAGRMPKDLRYLSAYRGGRVDVFNLRRQRANLFDIHSSYPRSFLDASEREMLWHVELVSKDWHGPLFDSSVTDMLSFPSGVFRSYVFKSNYERYIEPYATGLRIKILRKIPLDFGWIVSLKTLIEKIYQEKMTSADAGIVECCKFLLNAFYGRIGLKPETERARILSDEPDCDDVLSWRIGRKCWLCFDKVERETRSNYPFAAFITDNARARLFKAIKQNDPLYCDTDSIFTANPKRDFSEHVSPNLGDWGHKGYKVFKANNVKDYEWDDEHILKGGKRSTVWTMKQFAKGGTVLDVQRTSRATLRKRIVLPNGDTRPLTKTR